MLRVGAPLPLQPEAPRLLGVEVVLDLEAELAREILRALAHQQVMVGLLHHRLGDERRCAHALERRHGAGLPLRAMYAGSVELHDAVGVGQAAIAHAVVLGIELHDVDAGDERVEHVGTLGEHGVGLLHASDRAAVLEAIAVGRGDHDGSRGLRRDHRRRRAKQRPWRRR